MRAVVVALALALLISGTQFRPAEVVAAQLAYLRRHRLLFAEGDRVMSLVVPPPGEPAAEPEPIVTRRELPLVEVRR